VNPQHCLFVCTTCGSKWENGQRVGTSQGERLLEELELLHQNWDLAAEFPIQAVGCMSACSRSCAISFAAAGKHTYLFGDIPPTDPSIPLSNILDCAAKYYQHPTGVLPWAERPAPLKQGILAKIPPLTLPVTAHATP
jgi:predicted metal-binding protein